MLAIEPRQPTPSIRAYEPSGGPIGLISWK
jgi:hypothetical protein